MASPRRIYRIYAQLTSDAQIVADFQQARGEKVSGTVQLILKRDPLKFLARWAEEMHELCGVVDGTHDDSFLMEATQTWYWGSLHGAALGASWDDLAFDEAGRQAPVCGIATVPELRAAVDRLLAQGLDAKPTKTVLLWRVAYAIWCRQTPPDQQWTIDQLMEADLQEMKKRDYLAPILKQIVD